MKYYTIDEISNEIGLSTDLIRHRCYSLDIDTKKIGKDEKAMILDACSEAIERKADSKSFEQMVKSIKVASKEQLVGTDRNILQIMLDLAKKDFDDNQTAILQCQEVINEVGAIIKTSHNGTISSNPAVKTKNDLMKSQSTLRKDIMLLEQALNSVEDEDDSPFGEE